MSIALENPNQHLPAQKIESKPNGINRFFGRIVRYVSCYQSPLEIKMGLVARGTLIIENSSEKISLVIKALKSQDYSNLKHKIKTILRQMHVDEQQQLLSRALKIDFRKGQKVLGNRCLNLLTLDQLRTMAKEVQVEFESVQKTAEEFNALYQTLEKNDANKQHKVLQKKFKTPYIFKIISNFFRTIAIAFNLLNLGKEPTSYFETKYMLDIYWTLLAVPIQLIKFAFTMFVNPLKSFAVVVVGSVISAIVTAILTKVLKRCPTEFTDCKNFTKEMKAGTLDPRFGREADLEKIIQTLVSNNEISRKHPLVIGEPGIGKSDLMKALAWRIINKNVPVELQDNQVVYVNGGELVNKVQGPFALKDPLKQLRDQIGSYDKKIILVIDEFHAVAKVLGERLKSLTDTSPGSLSKLIGITTPQDYEEFIDQKSSKAEKKQVRAFQRRFKKIELSPTSEKQTLRILRYVLQQTTHGIKISNKNLKAIFEKSDKEMNDSNQPDKAVDLLRSAIAKVRHLRERGDLIPCLHRLQARRERHVLRLNRKKINIHTIHNQSVNKLREKIAKDDKDIAEIENTIQTAQKHTNRFNELHQIRDWHNEWIAKASKQISKQTPQSLEKAYLFNNFFLLPTLDRYIDHYAAKNRILTQIDGELISNLS